MDSFTHPSPSDIVFIHGAGGNNLVWKRVAAGLAGDGTAYALNLPGHPSGPITCRSVAEYTEAVHGFILESGLRRPAVCGHSMGGAIAQTLAIDHPGDIGRLVLVGTGAKLGVRPDILEGLAQGALGAIERVITPSSFYSIELPSAREARMALSLSNPDVFLNDYLACRDFDVRQRLGEISARTMIICGEQDQMTPPRWAHYLHESICSSTLFFIREAGHMVNLEKPALVAGLVQAFLS